VTLVDSDVLIAHLRGVPAARDWLRHARQRAGPLSISAITVAEISGGMRSQERSAVWRLLSSLRSEAVDDTIARRAGEFMRRYRSSHHAIGLGDYLIAATAEVRGLRLATLNVRHFPMFKGLKAPFRL
jgi:predicted nucleic acid-binding protein